MSQLPTFFSDMKRPLEGHLNFSVKLTVKLFISCHSSRGGFFLATSAVHQFLQVWICGAREAKCQKDGFSSKGAYILCHKRLDEVRLKPRPLIVTAPVLSLVSDRSSLKTFFMDVIWSIFCGFRPCGASGGDVKFLVFRHQNGLGGQSITFHLPFPVIYP